MTRRTVINLVWFSLIAALFFTWAVRNILPVDTLRHPYRVRATFATSLGIQPGDEVAYLGVHYGAIGTVKRVTDGLVVTFKIDKRKHIPAGSVAHLYRKSAIGELYVDFDPPPGYKGTGGPWIRAGEMIPRARTTVPLEFSELLRSASKLVSAIPPQDVQALLHELAIGLDGRGESLRALTEAGDRISQTLAARTAALDRLATNNTRLTHVVTEHRDSLGQSLTDLRQVAASLRNARGDLATLLDRGAPLATQTADIVAHNKGNLDCVLKDLTAVTDLTSSDEQLANTRTVLESGRGGFGALWDVRDIEPDGVWARVGFIENLDNKAPQFIPTKTLPVLPPVPVCRSQLQPRTIDYTPASLSRPERRLPAPLGSGLLAAMLALVAAVVVLQQTGSLGRRR